MPYHSLHTHSQTDGAVSRSLRLCEHDVCGSAVQLNGLLLSNSWAGYHVLLNPDYSAATQWRFVNRAIDEVENNRV
jgi:hypothetical protein